MKIKINGNDYSEYLIQRFKYQYKRQFTRSDFIFSSQNVLLSNHNYIFSAMNKKSIFSKNDWHNYSVEIYNDYDELIYSGILKDIQENDSAGTANIIIDSILTLASTKTSIIKISNATPSEVVSDIIKKNISNIKIDRKSFFEGTSYLRNLGILINVNLTIDIGKSITSFCQDVAELAMANVYDINGTVFWDQDKPYFGEGGIIINQNFIQNKYYSWDDSNIIRSFNIKSYSGDPDNPYETKYGEQGDYTFEKDYSKSDKIALLSTPDQINTFYKKMVRFYETKKLKLRFTSSDDLRYIRIGKIILWTDRDRNIYNQPFKVFEKYPNETNGTIDFVCYALNISPELINDFDRTYPANDPVNFGLKANGNKILAYWNPYSGDIEIDHWELSYGQDIDYNGYFASKLSPIYLSSGTTSYEVDFSTFYDRYGKYFYTNLLNSSLYFSIVAIGKNGMKSFPVKKKIQFPKFASGTYGSGIYGAGIYPG